MDMCEQVHTCFEMKRKECKELNKKVKFLEQSLDELNATHERLMEAHEKLGKAHSKLEKAHSSLIEQVKEEAKKEQVIVSCDVGLTCDLIDKSFYKPIIVAPTNTSCSTTTSTSLLSDGLTCDVSLCEGQWSVLHRCKQVGHIEQYCKINKNKLPNVSSIKFDSCYML